MKRYTVQTGDKIVKRFDHHVLRINGRDHVLNGYEPKSEDKVILLESGDRLPPEVSAKLGIMPFELGLGGYVPGTSLGGMCVPDTTESDDEWNELLSLVTTATDARIDDSKIDIVRENTGQWIPVSKRGSKTSFLKAVKEGKPFYIREGIPPNVIPFIVILEYGDVVGLIDDNVVVEQEGFAHPMFLMARRMRVVKNLVQFAIANGADQASVAIIDGNNKYTQWQVHDTSLDFTWGLRTTDVRQFAGGMLALQSIRWIPGSSTPRTIEGFINSVERFKKDYIFHDKQDPLVDMLSSDGSVGYQCCMSQLRKELL